MEWAAETAGPAVHTACGEQRGLDSVCVLGTWVPMWAWDVGLMTFAVAWVALLLQLFLLSWRLARLALGGLMVAMLVALVASGTAFQSEFCSQVAAKWAAAAAAAAREADAASASGAADDVLPHNDAHVADASYADL